MNFKISLLTLLLTAFYIAKGQDTVSLYRVFEKQIINDKRYKNKYLDVEINVQYQAPSGKLYNFHGFYDGDGKGGEKGDVWKIRFMPNETGKWKYVYSWTDKTPGGNGTFTCVQAGAGKGILQAHQNNAHWLAYNGTEPVWLKSYYETGHGSLGQDFRWIEENVYQPLYDHGYNHLQVNWLLSLCCFGQYYLDGPEPDRKDLTLYEEGKPFETMDLDVWRRMEQHMSWLNDHDIGVHMFLGVDGSRNDGPKWTKLSAEQKDKFVRYMVARLAPFANLAGWNFVWEVPGDREESELGFARLVAKYDIFDHLRTYEDEMPRENEYHRTEYNFAAVENHKIAADDKDLERHLWKEAWTHHMACILGYEGKPVFMSEGNALWRRYWHEKAGADLNDLRQSAWACATAGASFTWNGHAKEYELYAGGESGLPFNDENPYQESEEAISILSRIMTREVDFYNMYPHDELLKKHSALEVYLLAEPGSQYLVFSAEGETFDVVLEPGSYTNVKWINAQTGKEKKEKTIKVNSKISVPFAPPSEDDWVLIIKND